MKTHVIKYLRSTGKWIEFWFEDGAGDIGSFDACCKGYLLWAVVDAGLHEHMLNHGLVGQAVVWNYALHRPERFVPAIGVRHDYLADLSE